jgi:hypothetical protein
MKQQHCHQMFPYQNLQENAQEMIDENIQDQEEEDHLPDVTPDSEDVEEEENISAEDEVEPSNPDCEMTDGNQSSQQVRANPVVQPNNNPQQDPQQERANPVVQPNNNPQQQAEGKIPGTQPNKPIQPEQIDAAAWQNHEGWMPGQLPTQSESVQPDYANLKWVAKEKIRGFLSMEVTCKK